MILWSIGGLLFLTDVFGDSSIRRERVLWFTPAMMARPFTAGFIPIYGILR
jgi:hypothetical protein